MRRIFKNVWITPDDFYEFFANCSMLGAGAKFQNSVKRQKLYFEQIVVMY